MDTSLHAPKKGLTSFQLKVIGVVLMVLDHIHQMFEPVGAPMWLTMLGRLVLPIFLFLLAEGYHYTHSKKDYLMRLLIAGWIMAALSLLIENLFPLKDVILSNNIFLTMFLGFAYMWLIDTLKEGIREKNSKKIVWSIVGMFTPIILSLVIILVILPFNMTAGIIAMLFVPHILGVEGGPLFVLLAVLFHLTRPYGRIPQMLALAAISVVHFFLGGVQWMMIFAVIPLGFYNGLQGRKSKWFFYIFYPAHIYLLYLLAYFLR